jgi:hypothetical protein
MFVVKYFLKSPQIFNNSVAIQSRLLNSSSNLNGILFKKFSPDSSPVKNISKKKRKISSSSEEEVEKPAPKKKDVSPSDRKKYVTKHAIISSN